jgi:hypothetical protein
MLKVVDQQRKKLVSRLVMTERLQEQKETLWINATK